jgi:signal peptidase I
VYPLVQQLERPWPVRVNEADIPKLFTAGMYNGVSALGSAVTAVAGLTTAFLVSQLVSLFFIPSKSMDPTMQVGDVWVVEKVTPRLLSFASRSNSNSNTNKVGDVVLFSPPAPLRDIVESNTSGGGRTRRLSDRDLFVKRVAAGPGDLVSVNQAGQVLVNQQPSPGKRDLCDEEPLRLIERYVKPTPNGGPGLQIVPNQVFVMGDCSSVSVDSRVWGPLDQSNIVGRPLFRIFPLNRIGGSLSLPTLNDFSE